MPRHNYDGERSWRRYDDDGEGRRREGAYGEPVRGGYGGRREGRGREGEEDWSRRRREGYGSQGYPGRDADWEREGPPSGERMGRGYGTASEGWGRARESFDVGREAGGREQDGGPHVGRGPRNYRRSDERIREDVCEILTQHGQIDASEVEVDVRDGEVTLRGTVDSRRTRRLAEEAVEDIPGVRDVHNELRAGGQRAETDRVGAAERVVVSGRQEEDPGYRYGSAMAADPRYRDRNWEDVEPELRTGYAEWSRRGGRGREEDEDAWERLREDVRRAWDEVRR